MPAGAPGTPIDMTPRDKDLDYEDQDAEPTLNAPEQDRPDGLTALDEPAADEEEGES
jgi:hypothetical protein